MNLENGIKVEVGAVYERRDGLRAFVYQKSNVTEFYRAIVIGTGESFSVHENGAEYLTEQTKNDLIKKIAWMQ